VTFHKGADGEQGGLSLPRAREARADPGDLADLRHLHIAPVMRIAYGVFLALLYPHASEWRQLGFAAGVLVSGVRDLAKAGSYAVGPARPPRA
jgi:hypothetical protein